MVLSNSIHRRPASGLVFKFKAIIISAAQQSSAATKVRLCLRRTAGANEVTEDTKHPAPGSKG